MEVQEAAVAALAAAPAAEVLAAEASEEALAEVVSVEVPVPEVSEVRPHIIITIITVPISVGDLVRAVITEAEAVAWARSWAP